MTPEDVLNHVRKTYVEERDNIAPLIESYYPNRMILLDALFAEDKIGDLAEELNDIYWSLPNSADVHSLLNIIEI